MSERNVELHRCVYEAFNSRDVEAFIAYCDPKIELHSGLTMPGGAIYHGHDGVRRWHRDVEEAFGDEIRVEPEAYFALGERTIGFHILRGRGRQSGVEVTGPYAHVFTWHEGALFHFKGYPRREDALTDLGISEDALEPIAP